VSRLELIFVDHSRCCRAENEAYDTQKARKLMDFSVLIATAQMEILYPCFAAWIINPDPSSGECSQ